jgi:hypothetical protein
MAPIKSASPRIHKVDAKSLGNTRGTELTTPVAPELELPFNLTHIRYRKTGGYTSTCPVAVKQVATNTSQSANFSLPHPPQAQSLELAAAKFSTEFVKAQRSYKHRRKATLRPLKNRYRRQVDGKSHPTITQTSDP